MKKMLLGALIVVGVLFMLSISSILAQGFCKGDFNYNGSVAAEDVETFLEHFGRNPFNNPCPPDGPTPVAKTGQTTCYTGDSPYIQIGCEGTGQDGEYQKGVELPNPRFTDNENGTVTDNLTGLIWLKDANCFGQSIWIEALSDCNNLADGQCGLTDGSNVGDWRLPNLFELESLRDMQYYDPALPNTAGTGQWSEGDAFNNVVSYAYWSSTNNVQYPVNAWAMDLYDGYQSGFVKSYKSDYVWPVRGGH